MGWMALAMLVAVVLVAATVAVIALAAVRAGRRGDLDDRSARSLLDHRLAIGEIDSEEYYEREAALRSAQPLSRAPRRRRPLR